MPLHTFHIIGAQLKSSTTDFWQIKLSPTKNISLLSFDSNKQVDPLILITLRNKNLKLLTERMGPPRILASWN
jgi:hypothetical protein